PLRHTAPIATLNLPSSPTRRSSDLSGQVFECVEGFLRQVGGGGQVRLGIGIGAVVLVGAGDGGVLLRRVGRVQLLDLFLIESVRSEEHTSELQSRFDIVCRLLLEKK